MSDLKERKKNLGKGSHLQKWNFLILFFFAKGETRPEIISAFAFENQHYFFDALRQKTLSPDSNKCLAPLAFGNTKKKLSLFCSLSRWNLIRLLDFSYVINEQLILVVFFTNNRFWPTSVTLTFLESLFLKLLRIKTQKSAGCHLTEKK